MFDIGFLELLIIGVVGLLVLGPERLPKAARTAGLWIGKIKRTVSGMQREINSQLEAEELRQKLEEHQKKLDSSFDKVRKDVENYVSAPESSNTNQASALPASGVDADAPDNIEAPLDQGSLEQTPNESSPTASDAATADNKDASSR